MNMIKVTLLQGHCTITINLCWYVCCEWVCGKDHYWQLVYMCVFLMYVMVV